VPRYHYWHTSPRQFGLPQPSLLERSTDEAASSGPLSRLVAMLKRLHAAFYSAPGHAPAEQRDVRQLLAAERKKVLQVGGMWCGVCGVCGV
jgi:RNA polymerase II C-terminal domain phosphatase-like 3/4